ncbi:MAG: OmpA family protein [Streptosporangiales bacterium]|jgi:outer membrane protein OmpA-like peptidoglycan-associated protein|nr:OmpA family protein [Streptosporangiales bacterium]
MKAAVDTGLAGSARTALASKDVAGVSVHSDWASLTLRGRSSSRAPALAAVRAMPHAGAVHTVTYVCAGGAPCSSVPAASVPPAAPSSPSPAGIEARIRGVLGTGGVTFATGSTSLTPRSAAALSRVASMLAREPGLRVRIAGYTDDSGPAAVNQALSLARASATRDYLAAHGVSASRLAAAGYGAEDPVATNATAAGRAANRRIEFTVQGS